MSVSPDPPRADSAIHVSLIGYSPVLTAEELAELHNILRARQAGAQSYLVLHHGCRPGSDEVAHRIVRHRPAWRIEGHPDTDGSPEPADRIMDDVDFVHRSKTQVERDAEIAGISHVLIVISSRSEDGSRIRSIRLTGLRSGQETIDLQQSAQHSATGDQTGIWEEPVSIGNREDRVPPGNSVYARPAGLPGLGKRR